jgi:hypothetical protein
VDKIVHLVMWIFVGAIAVLVVTHAAGFSTAVTAVGGQVTNNASLLAGYAPAQAAATSSAQVNTAGASGAPPGAILV